MMTFILVNILGFYSCSSYGSQELLPFDDYYSESIQTAKITVVDSEVIEDDTNSLTQECGSISTYTVDKVFFGSKLEGKFFSKKPVPLGKYYALIFEAGEYEKFKDILSEEDVRSLFCYREITSKYIDRSPSSLYPIIDQKHVFVEDRNPLLSEIDDIHKASSVVFNGVKGFKIQMDLVEKVFDKKNER